MDSGAVQSEVHENDEHYPHIVVSEQGIYESHLEASCIIFEFEDIFINVPMVFFIIIFFVSSSTSNFLDVVTHGAEEDHFDEEKKSVLNKVKAKAKKIKDTIKKHGHQVLDRGHVYNNEDQHTLDDHDLDEDDEMAEDPQVHKTPSMFFSKSSAIRG